MTHEIPIPLFDEFCENYSGDTLTNNKVRGINALQNRLIVIIGVIWNGKSSKTCHGYEVIPIELYKGKPEPLGYNENNKREGRGYKGQLFTYKKKKYVFIGKEQIEFKPAKKEKEIVQLGLF